MYKESLIRVYMSLQPAFWVQAVPGGKPVLLAVGLSAGGIIVNQFFSSILGSHLISMSLRCTPL